MAGQSSAMFGWSWTDVSVLGSQVFGQALMDSCALDLSCYQTQLSTRKSVEEIYMGQNLLKNTVLSTAPCCPRSSLVLQWSVENQFHPALVSQGQVSRLQISFLELS